MRRTSGLDMARYTAEMEDHIYLQKVREHIEGGRRSHIRATPTFFVNGVVQDISFGMKALHDSVAAAVGRGCMKKALRIESMRRALESTARAPRKL